MSIGVVGSYKSVSSCLLDFTFMEHSSPPPQLSRDHMLSPEEEQTPLTVLAWFAPSASS